MCHRVRAGQQSPNLNAGDHCASPRRRPRSRRVRCRRQSKPGPVHRGEPYSCDSTNSCYLSFAQDVILTSMAIPAVISSRTMASVTGSILPRPMSNSPQEILERTHLILRRPISWRLVYRSFQPSVDTGLAPQLCAHDWPVVAKTVAGGLSRSILRGCRWPCRMLVSDSSRKSNGQSPTSSIRSNVPAGMNGFDKDRIEVSPRDQRSVPRRRLLCHR